MFVTICLWSQTPKGQKLFEQKRYGEAAKAFMKPAKKGDVTANYMLGRCHLVLKNYNEAEAAFAKTAESTIDDKEFPLFYGQALKRNNKIAEAKAQFEKYVAVNPGSVVGQTLLSSSTIQFNDFEYKRISSALRELVSLSLDKCTINPQSW